MKRVFDLFLIATSFPLMILVCLYVALMVRCTLGHPILFRQLRPGLNSKIFNMVKFRTMTSEYDTNGNLLPDSARLTKFGKFLRSTSLDELPSLWSVVTGDMSLVGPRPLLVEYLPLYSDRQARRHEVKPGITGWAQVSGRNTVSWEDKFEYDVWYVDHQSFGLDLKILWMTLIKVIRSEGISQEGQTTVEKF